MEYAKQLSERINSDIQKLEFNSEPENLYAPIRYTLNSGGKRIRAALCIMAAELFGGKYEDAIEAAIGIETFHNFTLIHDDIMDKSLERRGKMTVYKKWNTDIGILSGDAMSVLALKFVAKVRNFDILEIFTQTAIEICEGQQYDMDFEKKFDVSVEEYLKMIKLKTSVLLAASLKTGALLAGASKEECENLYNLGINVGVAYQLQDDFLDTYGDTETFKKGQLGNDIFSNKKTFLLITALAKASPDVRKELISWLNIDRDEKFREEKFNAVKTIFNNLQVKEDSEKLINKYFKEATLNIDNIGVSESKKKEFRYYINSLKNRNY